MPTTYQARVTLGDGWRTTVATPNHADSHIDLPVALGGPGEFENPEESVLAALGACTALTLMLYARRKQWALQNVDVQLTLGEGGLQRKVTVSGALDDEQTARLKDIADKCPIHKLLTAPPAITTNIARA